ncbi:MAG: transposase [Verrucomicrobiales bacterium]|nr:transposase [Verrucomicrobiales bacterium]
MPHRDEIGLIQSLTFRLADSLPQEKLRELAEELQPLPQEQQNPRRRIKIEQWLDAGMGGCALRHPAVAQVMENSLLFGDGTRYRLLAWCIMPNHVHVLIKPLTALSAVVKAWKSFTAHWALAHWNSLGAPSSPTACAKKPTRTSAPPEHFWQREVWDRYLRDERHWHATIEYIHNNPVQAGLCQTPAQWHWSSAYGTHSR